ncbi:cubilin isoform X2 [Musca domestica]|uniref:Cubilin isoform X2 n=1 Tax=Musca domestica TaxID=7370 RepID=A0ABM3UTR9_MUSDO|nr:cubilin isoform X2 [Musca domestica]
MNILLIVMHMLMALNWLVHGKTTPTSANKNLFLECSCLQAQDHNGTSKMPTVVAVNASMARHAKNDCYIIFVIGTNEEIISLRFQHLHLRPNCLDYIEIFPYLREAVVENTTQPEYIFCNYSTTASTTASFHVAKSNNITTNVTTTSPPPLSNATATSSPPSGSISNIGHLPNVTTLGNISTTTLMNSHDLSPHQFIYSSGKVFAVRLRFNNKQLPPSPTPLPATSSPGDKEAKPLQEKIDNWNLNVTVEYRFLKKERFKNDGRLIPGTYCDYYFFANPDVSPKALEIWKNFHSPRFPAKYPAHIKCSYKFIGRPETRVELIFEELEIPRDGESCNLDKLTIFDAESLNMNAVIDVLCGNSSSGNRHILSTGPDLLIEFNASSNVTAKGFRGKFKFIPNNEIMEMKKTNKATDIPFVADMYSGGGGGAGGLGGGLVEADTIIGNSLAGIKMDNNVIRGSGSTARKQNLMAFNAMDSNNNAKVFKGFSKEGNFREIFESRYNKSGTFDTNHLFSASRLTNLNMVSSASLINTGRIECIYEFYASNPNERVQIKFLDFNIPTDKNSTDCKPNDSLQLLTQVKGKYEVMDWYCGAFLPKHIMSTGPKLTLQFIGRYPSGQTKIGYYGFKAEYTFLTNYGISTGIQLGNNCSFAYNSTDKKMGYFTSPNFPGLYPKNINCDYFFHGELDEKVIIRFSYFDVEGVGSCEYLTASDYVEFSNFLSTDRKFPKYCGKRDKFEIRSDDRFFRVSFHSNDRFDRSGFRAYYEFEGKSTPAENTSVQSYVFNQGTNFERDYKELIAILFIVVIVCSLV